MVSFFAAAPETIIGGGRRKSIGAGNKVSTEEEDELLLTVSQLISRRVITFNEGSHLILISSLFVCALFCVWPECSDRL